MTKICLILLLIKSTLIGFTLGACKVHDAKWINIMPIVTQPSRTHPEKGLYLVPILPSKKAHDICSYLLVKIDWKRSIQNSRCVDFYHVYAWKAGQPKERGQKIPIMNKNATSTELIIEPCVNYNFAVEFTEKDWLVFTFYTKSFGCRDPR